MQQQSQRYMLMQNLPNDPRFEHLENYKSMVKTHDYNDLKINLEQHQQNKYLEHTEVSVSRWWLNW